MMNDAELDAEFDMAMAAKSDQINNVDLTNTDMTVTIVKVSVKTSDDQKVSISLKETGKFYRPCKGMMRVMADVWGKPSTFIGKRLTIYRDPDVKFGADTTGGIRISHMSDIDAPKKVTVPVSRGKVKAYVIKPLRVEQQASEPPQIDTEAAQTAARAAAGQGKAAFTAWWNGDGRALRDAVKPIMPELTKLAADADGPPPDNDDAPPM